MIVQCTRCGNDNPAFFYHGKRGWYCRKCIRYISAAPQEDHLTQVDSEYSLSFQLTPRQQKVSQQLVRYINQNSSVLLEAVCGAGKTELVYEVIADQLSKGKKVGFAIPRRQVVIEIATRLQSVFTRLKVVPVCQGYTSDLYGDLIVCTTHQLYRYYRYFDLLIIDEPDAFPFKGNTLLHGFAQSCNKGNTIYLTATPDNQLKQLIQQNKLQHVYLSKRPSGKDMIVPQTVYGPKEFLLLYGLFQAYLIIKKKEPVIFFVPSIRAARRLYKALKVFVSCCQMDSLTENRDELIQQFRQGKYYLMISTTVLERGVTFSGVHVIVYQADSNQFDAASLTQMAGRVGRDIHKPTGLCLFLCRKKVETIDECIAQIKRANDD